MVSCVKLNRYRKCRSAMNPGLFYFKRSLYYGDKLTYYGSDLFQNSVSGVISFIKTCFTSGFVSSIGDFPDLYLDNH